MIVAVFFYVGLSARHIKLKYNAVESKKFEECALLYYSSITRIPISVDAVAPSN